MSPYALLTLLGSLVLVCECSPQLLSLEAVSDSDLSELEGTPFMLRSGVPYRDQLTIGASQAVAQFASRFQPEERQRILQRERALRGRNSVKSPKFYSATLNQLPGRAKLDTLEFATSRRIRIPEDLRRDRVLADRDEALLIAERDAADHAAAVAESNSLPNRPRPSSLSRPSLSSGNYQSVVGHGHSYSTNHGYAGTSAPYVATTTTTSYTSYPHPPIPTSASYTPTVAPLSLATFDYAYPAAPVTPYPYPSAQYYVPSPAPAVLPSPRPTVDYNIQVSHGASGGSYSYSTFG